MRHLDWTSQNAVHGQASVPTRAITSPVTLYLSQKPFYSSIPYNSLRKTSYNKISTKIQPLSSRPLELEEERNTKLWFHNTMCCNRIIGSIRGAWWSPEHLKSHWEEIILNSSKLGGAVHTGEELLLRDYTCLGLFSVSSVLLKKY